MLYRVLVAVQVWAAVSAAPQDIGDITHVQVEPIETPPHPGLAKGLQDNIPLTTDKDVTTEPDSSLERGEFQQSDKNFTLDGNNKSNHNVGSEDQSDIIKTDIELSGSELEEAVATDDQPDSFPEETSLSGRAYEYTTVADPIDITETIETLTEVPEDEARPRFASPRSLSKFNAKKKTNTYSFTANLIDKSEKRKFRSTCKCMRIWNCPKLQISVGRCSEEFFLCCF